MSKLLRALRAAIIYGPPLDATEHPYATATTPDQLIAEAMKVSMAKDINGWTRGGQMVPDHSTHVAYPSDQRPMKPSKRLFELVNQDRSMRLTWRTEPHGYEYRNVDFRINDIEFDAKAGLDLIEAYGRLRSAYDTAQATALKAKLAMEANENKWNLAESLLGMKRTEDGALVPLEAAA
jgi:hypothetical protein